MSVQLPQRFLVVPHVDVVDVSNFRAGQEAEGVEMVPQNALYFALDGPALETLGAAVVDANLGVAAARQQRLDLERVKLEALHLLRMT